jgi:hypothetical protein
VRRRVTRFGPPSARLAGLIEGDLGGYRREAGGGARVRFVPVGEGPVIDVVSRIEKRFLGRTETAVFEADLDGSLPEESTIALKHTGGLKRSGVTAVVVDGGDAAQSVAEALASDRKLTEALLPLDFTRFEVHGDATGCRARVELIGASHVAIALPPIRSYVHLYPDQREAMVTGLEEAARVLRAT